MSNLLSLVVMAKVPRSGYSKTRLSPLLKPKETEELCRAMLLDTVDRLRAIVDCELWLAFTPSHERHWFESNLDPEIKLMPQRGNDLGERMQHIVEERLFSGSSAVLIVGSDLPTLPVRYVCRAAELVKQDNIIVIGPAEDGGYYLIGMREPSPWIFDRINWGTNLVFQQTLMKAEALGKSIVTIPQWFDVDEPADLERLKSDLEDIDQLSRPKRTADFFLSCF